MRYLPLKSSGVNVDPKFQFGQIEINSFIF
jgi:hypothetical protein